MLLAAGFLVSPVWSEEPAAAAPPAATAPAAPVAPAPPTPAAPAAVPAEIVRRLQSLYDAGSDTEAIQAGEAWLKDHPADVDVRLAVVRSIIRKAVPLRAAGNGMLQVAYNHLQAALVASPARQDVRVAICDVLFHLERHEVLLEEVASLLKDALDAPSRDVAFEAVSFYAEEYSRAGRPDRGAELYGVICGVLKDSPEAALNHGTLLLLSGRIDEGIAEFQRSAKLDSSSPEAPHSIGQACVYKGDFAKAEEWLGKTVALEPGSGRFILDLAVVKSLTHPAEAPALFEKASGILGEIAAQKILVENLRVTLTSRAMTREDWLRLVSDLQHTGYPIYALVAAEKALRADPAQPEIVLTRADIYDQGRFWKAALEQYRLGSELARNSPAAAQPGYQDWSVAGMARALTRTGDPSRAIEMLRTAGGEQRFPFEMADALWRSGKAQAAMDILERLATSGDEDRSRAARQKMQDISTGR